MTDSEKEGPDSNIKEYIVNARKNGFPDSKIIENLKKTNWPDDIIESAIGEADKIIPAVSEEEQPTEEDKEEPKEVEPKEYKKEDDAKEVASEPDKKESAPKESEEKKNEPSSNLLTKPPEGIFPDKKEGTAQEPVKKKFSFLALLSLLLSPIPFIGLGVAMAAIDNIRKNNKSGTILAIIALIINVIIILGIIYIIFQIFTLEPDKLPGFAKYVNDKLNLV